MTKKIVEYQMIRTKFDEFDDEVRRQLKKGWQPYGEPFVFAFHFGMGIAQGLVKYEEDEVKWDFDILMEALEKFLSKLEK